jgi:hypothetical protein
MYLSPRLMRGFLAQVYLLNDPFHNFPNFKLVHTEQSTVVASFNQQGAKFGDFVIYGDVQGPIKIWEIDYTGNEKVNPEYLRTTVPDYIDWQF